MPGKTLQTEINKKRSVMKTDNIAEKLTESEDLSKVIDYMSEKDEYSKDFTAKGFTKDEVMQTAKFALKADPYDISVRHLDVEDSPVYYKMGKNNKLKSRGRLTRKDLDDAGKHLIKRAKEVKVILEQQKLEREEREINKLLEDSATMDIGADINEAEASKQSEARNMEGYETSKVLDNLANYSHYFENMDKFFDGTILGMDKEQKLKKDQGRNSFLNIVNTTLDKSLPSLGEFKKIMDDRIKQLMGGELVKIRSEYGVSNETIIARLRESKENFVAQANEKIQKYKTMYDMVRDGEMAPEVLKLYLNSAVMNTDTTSANRLYGKLMEPVHMVEPTEQEDKEYRELLAENAIETHIDKRQGTVGYQVNDGMLRPYKWAKSAQNIGWIGKDVKLNNEKDAMREGIKVKERNPFIHFTKSSMKETNKRIYITCKPQKEKQMVDAWWKTLKANPKFGHIHFKLSGGVPYERQEKIVVYLPPTMKVQDFRPFLDSFSEACRKDDVLAEEKDSLITGRKLSPGIAFGVEPDIKLLRDKIDDGWYNKQEYETMFRLTKPNKEHVDNDYKCSYNMYVNKALILSCMIAKKKLNIGQGESVNEKKAQLVPLMKKYFADFMRLAGADPKTLDNIGVVA
ncbi:MAG: hypothetical protein K6F54_05670 [Lachnospiraceae bacterium]|nr:hypothetical protein [Lachnospiraceae bacterium]